MSAASDLLNSAINDLKQTTKGYTQMAQPMPSTTYWAKAFTFINQLLPLLWDVKVTGTAMEGNILQAVIY